MDHVKKSTESGPKGLHGPLRCFVMAYDGCCASFMYLRKILEVDPFRTLWLWIPQIHQIHRRFPKSPLVFSHSTDEAGTLEIVHLWIRQRIFVRRVKGIQGNPIGRYPNINHQIWDYHMFNQKPLGLYHRSLMLTQYHWLFGATLKLSRPALAHRVEITPPTLP